MMGLWMGGLEGLLCSHGFCCDVALQFAAPFAFQIHVGAAGVFTEKDVHPARGAAASPGEIDNLLMSPLLVLQECVVSSLLLTLQIFQSHRNCHNAKCRVNELFMTHSHKSHSKLFVAFLLYCFF
jgi:hypothetical protein